MRFDKHRTIRVRQRLLEINRLAACVYALPLEGSTGAGDSGGPVIVDFNDGVGPVIVGDLNGGFNPFGAFSEYGDVSIWARLGNSVNQTLLASHGIVPIPEPSAFLFLGFVGASLGAVRWFRTAK